MTLISSDGSGIAGPRTMRSLCADGFIFETHTLGVSVPEGDSIQAVIRVGVP